MNDCQRSAEALARAKTKGGCKNLREEVTTWGTPTVDAISNRKTKYAQGGTPIAMQASSWPTPRKVDTEDGNENNVEYSNGHFSEIRKSTQVRYGAKLCNATVAWPTPRTQEPGRTREGYGRGLAEFAEGKEQMPTPRMNDFKGHVTDATTRKDGKCPNDQLQNAAIHTGPLAQVKQSNGSDSSKSAQTSPQPLKKRLNPKFVEHLMGIPTGWSLPIPIDQKDYKRWETESCHLLRLLHTACYGNE